MNKKTFIQKSNGDTLNASEWNELTGYVNEAVDAINAGGSSDGGTVDNSFMYVNDKGNLCIETTTENTPTDKKGKINIESRDDIQVKPGDDFTIVSSHRPVANMDEVSVKIHDGEDHPVKLQLNAADIVLTTKDKDKTKTKDENGEDTTTALYDDPSVMNITVNSAKNTRGYLKVRAQAIDLRSESHGGIALQPKGTDGTFENKIKFEHGGGDGLEFGTFNTQHTSLYTNDYRFKKDGIIRLATRTTVPSDKADENDPTTAYKYVKAADDFYDNFNVNDPTCTWEDVVRYISWAKNHNEGTFRNFFTGLDDGSGWSHSDSNSGNGTIISESGQTLYVISPAISLDAGTYKLSWETNDLTQTADAEPNCEVLVLGNDLDNPIYQSSEGGTGRMEVTFTINETIQNLSVEFTFTACDRIIQPKLEQL